MVETIIEYDGEIPTGILQGQFSEDEFYNAEEVRRIILDSFPENGKNPYSGLESICHGNVAIDSGKEFSRLIEESESREQLITQLIPTYQEVGEGLRIEIVESQVYKNKDPTDKSPYKQHVTSITLTDLGYVLAMHHYLESNNA